MNKYIRIRFGNSCDIPPLYLSDGWMGEMYLDADLNEFEEDILEQGDEDSRGNFTQTYLRSVKRYVLRLGLMGLPTLEKLHKLRFFDNVELTTKTGEIQQIYRIDFSHDWQFDEKYFATGELRFDMNEIIEKNECCAAYVEPPQPKVYGFLYNWYAATDARGIAASGWGVPTDAEWTGLNDYIAAEIAAERLPNVGVGSVLKSARTAVGDPPVGISTNEHPRWDYHNSNYGRDSIGFGGHGGGRRAFGLFSTISVLGRWWSSTELDADNAWGRFVLFNNNDTNRGNGSKSSGYSARLIRPATSTEKTTKFDGDACELYEGNDGKFYRTVYIGENDTDNAMVWTADNLEETKYANGDWIAGFDGGVYTPITNANWEALTTGALCAYEDDLDNV